MTGAYAVREEAAQTSPRRASGVVAAVQLRSIVERVERMEEEKAAIAADIKDIYAEAKGNGYDTKTLRKVIALRRLDAAERDEADHLLDTYCVALGMKAQMDLFEGKEEPFEGAATEESFQSAISDLSEDEVYAIAVNIVLRDRNASTSYLQRMLRLGYNRAARLVERMESESILGPANHVGKREVLAVKA